MLHPNTISELNLGINKFSKNLQEVITYLLQLTENNSPLMDVKSLGIAKFDELKINNSSKFWLPLRNLIRIFAYIAKYSEAQVSYVYIDSMYCGCDYFEGRLKIITENQVFEGNYKWQWTAFSEYDRSFDKFVTHPMIMVTH